jgi:putative transposase
VSSLDAYPGRTRGGREASVGVVACAALVLPYNASHRGASLMDIDAFVAKARSVYTGPERKPMRAPGFDYRDPGPYYVTICSEFRLHRFGSIAAGEMHLNDPGVMVQTAWRSIPRVFPGVTLDAHVVMPNHLHGVLVLAIPIDGTLDGEASLSQVMQWLKTETTNRYIRGVRRHGWDPFQGKLWQRGYWDEIVRTDARMDEIRAYIATNPAEWDTDTYRDPEPLPFP